MLGSFGLSNKQQGESNTVLHGKANAGDTSGEEDKSKGTKDLGNGHDDFGKRQMDAEGTVEVPPA